MENNTSSIAYFKRFYNKIIHPHKKKSTAKWVFMLGSLFAIPAISGDMYLPCLPDLTKELHTEEFMAQLTISATMFGAAVGQMIVGPLLDRFGRRKPVIVGLILHITMSLACSFVNSIWMLIIFRSIQGAANASANVTGMAVHRDTFSGSKGAMVMSRLMMIVGIAPLFAPSIGTLLLNYGGWRAIFRLLALIGFILLIFVWLYLPDTLNKEKRLILSPKKALNLYVKIFRNSRFLALALAGGLAQSCMMVYVVASPFITEEQWHYSPSTFALIFAVNGIALVVGSQVNSFLVLKFKPKVILWCSLLIRLGFVLIMLVTSVIAPTIGILTLVPLFFVIFTHNFITSNAFVIAMSDQAKNAGTAAAIVGISNSLIPSVFSPLVGVMGNTNVALSVVLLLIMLLSILLVIIGTGLFLNTKKLPPSPEYYL